MAYDSNREEITLKSDVGTLIYDYPGKPYAVSGIDTSGVGLVIPEYAQEISYTSFESVSTISENDYLATFTYNSDNQRAKMVVEQIGNTILTRWYPSSSYIKETARGVTKEYTFIGGDAYSAPVVAVTQNGSTTYYYLLRDYHGSITHVVNASDNSVVAEYSYDAWGRMRNPATWENYTPGSEPAPFIAGRGYTGHACPPKLKRRREHLTWFNLINMKGRVYDPILARFLSPDPLIQLPGFTQSYNSYSYCVNNPLKFIDPGGYTVKAYNINKIDPAYFAEFLQALEKGGLDYAVSSVPHVSQTCYYDDETGDFTFWIDWVGSGGGSTYSTPNGYMLPEITVYSHKVTVTLSQKEFGKIVDPIDYFRNSWNPENRAGGYNNGSFINGVGGSLKLVNYAAEGLNIIKRATEVGGYGLTAVNIASIYRDRNSNGLSLGDKARIGYNLLFGLTDTYGSSLIFSILDSYGIFEYDYQQFDILENTGYWVYYNKWSGKWEKKKFPWLNKILKLNQ
ncbi:MAG: RHS repeat-associated core domain-containing protein [Ignavibacterium sp.]